MKIEDLLERMVKEGASDGFITADAPPSIKVDGQIYPISGQPLNDAEAEYAGFVDDATRPTGKLPAAP